MDDKEIKSRLYFGIRQVLPELIPFLREEYQKHHELLSPEDNTIQPDIGAEERGVSIITERFPGDAVVAEERSKADNNVAGRPASFGWTADFLDGSTNFRKHRPYFAISMSLNKGKDLLGGLICDPIANKKFYAIKGRGAYLDRRPLSVSVQKDLSKAKMGLISLNSYRKHNELDLMQRLYQAAGECRTKGCTSLELAACAAGELDAVVKPTKNNWLDAGILMVEEAGGKVTAIDRSSHKIYVASNPYIHDELCRIVRERK
ncbi:hypothetical protein GF371_01290 [Candidatus Woesearchaeota archaeon]|nr:hypothetical protein [Candidatus Woesearchaeota archaeon]